MPNKLRLLIFHPTIAPYRIDLFNRLSKEFETKICLSYRNLRDQKFDNYDKLIEKLEFKPHYLKKFLTIRNRVLCRGYWKEISKYDPDIVIVSEFGLDALSAISYRFLFRKKYKIVSICDDSYNMLNADNDFSTVHRSLRKKVVPRIDELILVEPKSAEWYRHNYPKGICFPIVAEDNRVRDEYKAALCKSQKYIDQYTLAGKHLFLFVGRLVSIKNIDLLIRAFSASKNKDSVLVIVGDGPERENLEQAAKESGRNIIFTGRLEGEDLYAWYNLATCFILPSIQEAFGAVTNEAMLGGCKCLVSVNAGSQSLVTEGINGFTFSPYNSEELTDLIDQICHNERPLENIAYLRQSMMTKSFSALITPVIEHLNNL